MHGQQNIKILLQGCILLVISTKCAHSYHGPLKVSDIVGLIPEILQLDAPVTLANLGRCYKLGEYEKPCACGSACFCSLRGGCAGIGLLA